MTTSQTRSQAASVRQSLHLRIEPSPYTSSEVLITARTPSSAAMSTRVEEDETNSPSENNDHIMFSVLCMHDFASEEAGLLSFKKNEILDIIKRDNTGWWAAMRPEGSVVGWIPQAFVRPLSSDMSEKLRNIGEEFRIPEYDAEQLYNSAPVAHTLLLFDSDSTTSSPTAENASIISKPSTSNSSATSYHSSWDTGQTNGKKDENINPYSTTSQDSPRSHPNPPPSPSSPVPHPPSRSVSQNKPTQPIPLQADNRIQRGCLSSSRCLRRRPVLNDNPTLSRISALVESNNRKEIDKLASPDIIVGSFEAISKRSREDRMQRRKGNEDSKHVNTAAHSGRSWYLQPQYKGQLDEDNKGHIRSGTLPALIERLTTETGTSDLTKIAESRTFTNVFLMTFTTFTTAGRLFELLVDRFHIKPPKSLTESQRKDWKANLRIPVQRRVLDVFSIWLEEYRLLEEEAHIDRRLTDFLSSINAPPHNATASAIMKRLEHLNITIPVTVPTTTVPKKARKSKAHKNDLLKLDPVDVAEQLSLFEFSLYVKITPQECLTYAKTQAGGSVARLQEFCSTHDKLGSWVKTSILNNEALSKRADTVDFWIKVAEKCRLLNNFASMSAIIIALSSTVISQLHSTWARVNRKSHLDALLRHNEPIGGFAGYRALLLHAEGSCVPFISMFLADIIHVQEQFDNLEDGRICFYQRARWCEIISNILKFQSRPYSIVPSESIMNFIESHLRDVVRDQNWYWVRSQQVQHSEVAHADIRKGLEATGF